MANDPETDQTDAQRARTRLAGAICAQALQRPAWERAAVLDEACDDDALRREVEDLIEKSQQTLTVLARGWDEPNSNSSASWSLQGKRLGKFEIDSRIGQGGMGEVYMARDTSLDRSVALKLLRPQLFKDKEGAQLFMREAKAASALNHPNIITIYEFGQADGLQYMATEFIEGVTLRKLSNERRLALTEVLPMMSQVAAALDSAHRAGIVHRDIKPENIMVRPDGLVKVLDFGLAQLSARRREPLVDQTLDGKTPGVRQVEGTVNYMSPEQAQGLPVDERSDIFSFGVVLYEMFAARRPFLGSTVSEVIAAIVNSAPAPFAEVPEAEDVRGELERIVRRALEKEPAARFATARELGEALNGVGTPMTGTAPGRPRSVWIGAALAVLAVLGLGLYQMAWLPKDRLPPMQVKPLTADVGYQESPSFSPDGTQVAYSWSSGVTKSPQIYAKAVMGQTPRRIVFEPGSATEPAWSPDGKWIAYKTRQMGDGGLSVVSATGGAGRRIADGRWLGHLTWTPDGKYIAVGREHSETNPQPGQGELILVPVEGGVPKVVLRPEPGQWCLDPDFHPSEPILSYSVCEGPLAAPRCQARKVSLNAAWSPRGPGSAVTPFIRFLSHLRWTVDGQAFLYSSGSAAASYLWRVDARGGDSSRLEVAGALAFDPTVARRGNRAAYRQFIGNLDVWRMDERGNSKPHIISSYLDDTARYSPDGARIVFSTQRGLESRELWLADADGSGQAPLTNGPGVHQGSPVWSPDGRWIAFDSQDRVMARWQIWVIAAAGGVPRQLTSLPRGANVPFWSRDGRTVYFNSLHNGRKEIFRIPAAGGAAEPVTHGGGVVVQESPDGSTLYYTKTPGGSALFTMPVGGGAEKQVLSTVANRGFHVVSDGIFYQAARNERTEVRFHDLASGTERVIGSVAGTMDVYLSVAPDRKWILFTYSPQTGSNLMLIDNFR